MTSLPFLGSLAAATTATAVVDGIGAGALTTATAVVDQQQNDDDQQDPVAIATAEQITQTHVIHPLRWVTHGRPHCPLWRLVGFVVTFHSHCMTER